MPQNWAYLKHFGAHSHRLLWQIKRDTRGRPNHIFRYYFWIIFISSYSYRYGITSNFSETLRHPKMLLLTFTDFYFQNIVRIGKNIVFGNYCKNFGRKSGIERKICVIICEHVTSALKNFCCARISVFEIASKSVNLSSNSNVGISLINKFIFNINFEYCYAKSLYNK